ncbi:MAG: shikimate kinase [Thermoleophilia bacterium]|nr:shikimate kinase [Thermoleophilia bacterium]MDH3725023.1 shikimate kinase [Thermoleophilia bacterium]
MTSSTELDRWLVMAGYMGSGKSSVGRRLARALRRKFVDADAAIEKHAGMAIPEIFSKRGEVWFRRTEAEVIRTIVQERDPGVLALGGGALGSDRTRGLLSREATVIWLNVSPEVAWSRVGGSDRPLAADRGRFLRRAEAREPVYREAADVEIDADRPLGEVLSAVAEWAKAAA